MGGEKSSYDVREEHAKADPGYMAENSVGRPSCADELLLTIPQQLRQTYSHYRPLFDDANCRWRGPYSQTYIELSLSN